MWPFSPSLPKGVTKHKSTYVINPEIAYPIWLDMLELEASCYSLEVVKRCITKHLREIVSGSFSVTVKKVPHWKEEVNNKEINQAAGDAIIHWNRLKKFKLV